jgi:hypothetical protein
VASRLSSPRLRRRLLKLAALAAVAGVTATISILFWDTGLKVRPSVTESGPAVVSAPERSIRLSKTDHAAAISAAARFVATAVQRQQLDEAWELAGPQIRQGMTRAEWRTGNIPVVPYPVDAARWKLDYTYADEVGLQVYVLPRRGVQMRPMVFNMSLTAVGTGDARRWLVDSWTPAGGGIGSSPPASARGTVPLRTIDPPKAPLGTVWLFLPVILLGGLLTIPLALGLRTRRRNRLAEAAHRATLEL